MLPSSIKEDSPTKETIEEKLDAMPMEDFEVLLQQAYKPRPTNQQPVPEHAEIIKQLKGTLEGHGDNPTLANAKCHSSLQSLNNNESTSHPVPPNHNNHNDPTLQEPKGHRYGPQYGHLKNTSTLTTINSTSSLNSVGVDGESSHQVKPHPIGYFFNERDNDRSPTTRPSRGFVDSGAAGSSDNAVDMGGELDGIQGGGVVGANTDLNNPNRSCMSPDTTRCTTPNPLQHGTANKTPLDGSGRRLTERTGKKKISKVKEVSIEVKTIPGYRGDEINVEDLVQFVEGNSASNNLKKKTKKERGGAKAKETLVKSASLDENHLNARKRSSSSSTERPSSKSLKEVEKRSERAVSSHQIQISSGVVPVSQPQSSGTPASTPTPAPASTPTTVSAPATLTKKPPTVLKPQPNIQQKDECGTKKAIEPKRPVRDDEERPFELVTKKKKTKKTTTQREAESFSRGQAKDQSRREQTRTRRACGGERRISVCSAPESDNSDQSDDDSVRSLPAGECTPREHIPKQCASSGGTPQTSYADIAKVPEPRKLSPLPPPPSTPIPQEESELNANFPAIKVTTAISVPSTKGPEATPLNSLPSCNKEMTPDQKDCATESVSATAAVPAVKPTKFVHPPPVVSAASKLPPSGPPKHFGGSQAQAHQNQNQNQRSNVPPSRNRNQFQNQKNQLIIQSLPQPERPYLSTVIKTSSHHHESSSNQPKPKEEVKMLIEDITEFPDICASMSSLSTKPPFSKKTALNVQQNHNNGPINAVHSPFIPNNNNNNNSLNKVNKADHSVEKVEVVVVASESKDANRNSNLKNEGTVESDSPVSVLSLITDKKVVEEVICVVRPVFYHPLPKQQIVAELISSGQQDVQVPAAMPSSSVLEGNLVNGDYEQTDLDQEEAREGRSRNSASVSSSIGVSEAVVFCRGNVESEIPNQDVGVEFGFNVMENTTYLAQAWSPQSATGSNHPDASSESLPPETPPNPQQRDDDDIEMDDDDSTGQLQDETSCPTWTSPPPSQQQQQQHPSQQSLSYEKQMPRYSHPSHPRGPPPSLLGNYRGPSDPSNRRPQYPGRRQGSYRGRNGGDRVGLQQTQQQQQPGSSGAPLQVQQQAIMPQSQQFAMPIPLPSPTGCGPPISQVHYATQQQVPQPLPHHMLPHYAMMAAHQVAHQQSQGQVQQGYHSQQPPRVPPPPPHHYLPPSSIIGLGLGGMPIYAFQSQQQIPVSSSGGVDEGGMMQPQHMQPHQMQIPLPTGATNNMTLPALPMPSLMMPHQHGLQGPPNHPTDGSGGPSLPYIGTVEYGDGGMVPPGIPNTAPYLYYPPPNYVVPITSIEVESWMNGCTEPYY